MNAKIRSVSNVVNYPMLQRDLHTIQTAYTQFHVVTLLFPSPEKKVMACYKLGFEEFINMNKMFVQICVLLNNLMCYVVVFYVQESTYSSIN